MLETLHVKNLALISEAEVVFGPGLNILTGETGAGKSILIGSIHLALGEKVPRDMLRDNDENALVELTFSVNRPGTLRELEEMDLFPEEGQLILTRRITAGGRSVCRINGETVSAALMQRAASVLIDIHGQQEHQSLLTKKNHLRYLDAYASRDLSEPIAALAAAYDTYTACRSEWEEAALDEEAQARELSFLQYEVAEIDAAHLVPGEDEELEAEYRRLANARKILDAVGECRAACADGTESASDQIDRALRAILSVAAYDETVEALGGQLQEIDNLLTDFNRDMAGYADDFGFSDERFAEMGERLDTINHLKSKFGASIDEILAQKSEKEAAIEKLAHYEAYRGELGKRLSAAEEELKMHSQEVSDIRAAAAKPFVNEMKAALADLNFLDVRLHLEIERLDHYTRDGWDDARFFISTNPGEELKPLDAVASGGELSRIMLALKTVLAENDDIETLIFDEIDAGISGKTAQMVAEKIRVTARDHQVLCITHLPQIAAQAMSHFLIEKTSDASSTISEIRPLDREESVAELARMLGGARITEAVLQNAEEMKAFAEHSAR